MSDRLSSKILFQSRPEQDELNLEENSIAQINNFPNSYRTIFYNLNEIKQKRKENEIRMRERKKEIQTHM